MQSNKGSFNNRLNNKGRETVGNLNVQESDYEQALELLSTLSPRSAAASAVPLSLSPRATLATTEATTEKSAGAAVPPTEIMQANKKNTTDGAQSRGIKRP